MAEHMGGKSIGGPAVAANANAVKTFDTLDIEGEVHGMDVVIGGTLINHTTGTFLSANPTGAAKLARGIDDVDLILDAIAANGADFRIDEKRYLFQGELLSRVRSVLSFLTARDVQVTGCLVDGVTINATGGATKAFTIRLPIPFSLRDELEDLDGDAYKQGSEVVKRGQLALKSLVVSISNLTLKNGAGDLVITSLDCVPQVDHDGDKFYVGPTWKMNTDTAQPATITEKNLTRAKRLFLLVDNVSHGPYTQHGEVERDTMATADVIDQFNRNRRAKGGDNSASRAVPVIFPRKGLTNAEQDFTPRSVYLKDTAGNTQDMISVTHEAVDAAVKRRIQGMAQTANAGNVAEKKPTPPSAAAQGGVKPQNVSKLGVHFTSATIGSKVA